MRNELIEIDITDQHSTAREWGFVLDIARLFIEPEIARRAQRGEVETPVRIERFQVLQWTDQAPVVRINSEFDLIVQFEGIDLRGKKEGDPVEIPETATATAVRPVDAPNAAHATLFRLGSHYHFIFDFTYNRARARDHLGRAEEFGAAASAELLAGRLNSCVELTWSAAELGAMALLLLIPFRRAHDSRNHHDRARHLERFGRLNFPDEAGILTELNELRKHARYLDAPDSVEITEPLVRRRLAETMALLERVRQRAQD